VALVVSEDPAVQAVRELALVQVAVPELERGLVAAELERDPVVALERELDQAVVVLVRGHPRAQPAAALRTKSVTAAHPHDLVLLLEAEEDLAAAVAETTREPAAAEAVIAWAAEE
jgi:hypothetical protein